MHRAQQSVAAAILLVVLAGSLAGCYTLLKHPDAAEAPEYDDFSRCAECHESYSSVMPFRSAYVGPWWDYYELPWWYQRAIVAADSLGGEVNYRSIMEGEPARATGSGVGVSPLGGAGVPEMHMERGAGAAVQEEDKAVKKRAGEGPPGDKRSIEERSSTKRGSEDKAAEAKRRQSADETKDTSSSDETKNTNEKKEKP